MVGGSGVFFRGWAKEASLCLEAFDSRGVAPVSASPACLYLRKDGKASADIFAILPWVLKPIGMDEMYTAHCQADLKLTPLQHCKSESESVDCTCVRLHSLTASATTRNTCPLE